jgi:hypothetical protein
MNSQTTRIVFLLSLVTNLLFALFFVFKAITLSRTGHSQVEQLREPFEMLEVPDGYLVGFRSGRLSWFVSSNMDVGTNRTSIRVGPEQSISLFVNAANDRVESIVTELMPNGASPGYSISDFNADGIPDQRRLKQSNKTQIFYGGAFFDIVLTNDYRCIVVNGTLKAARFMDGHWQIEDLSSNPHH